MGKDRKGNLSVIAYIAAIAVAPAVPWLSIGVYVAVALAWLIPDRRMERVLTPSPRDTE